MPSRFDLQGHRGARGLKPENTLPSFEAALDAGVTSIETDVQLTCDGVPVLCHDRWIHERLFRALPGSRSPESVKCLAVRQLNLEELRGYVADRNPNPCRFPDQNSEVTAVAELYANQRDFHPYAPPTLVDLLAFMDFYAGEGGDTAGKTCLQRQRARHTHFDLELKYAPFHSQGLGDGFDGTTSGRLARCVVQVLREVGVLERSRVRSFDHRVVRGLRELEPSLTTAVLIAGTAPVVPAELACHAGAALYCPDYESLDEAQVRQLHAAGLRVMPWTVNDPAEWERLLAWGVDGITTDYPHRLAVWLQERKIIF